ncbi:MAG: hypothetical protein HXS52_12975 [Theionarchaea archaeon]|nr:hypothetical protein [Theionarchaea archaeon]MBU7038838.1 hypothetical protein [Theionarchaea archaeon]
MIRAAIVGVGYTDSLSVTSDASWKDVVYRATSCAGDGAGINPAGMLIGSLYVLNPTICSQQPHSPGRPG